MRARAKLRPGQPGTKKLLARYGDRLLCVRYRYDEATRRRIKTVELVVDEADWLPPRPDPGDSEPVLVRIEFSERALREKIKSAGGTWQPETKLWRVRARVARRLGLTGRIVGTKP